MPSTDGYIWESVKALGTVNTHTHICTAVLMMTASCKCVGMYVYVAYIVGG